MQRRGPSQRIEFNAVDPRPAVDALAELVAGAEGWMNLLPEVDEVEASFVTPSPVGAIFRAAGPPIPQVTIVAPTAGRGEPTPAQIGITHGVGRRVVPLLAAEGVPVPEDWKLVQDHVRRGLVFAAEHPLDGPVPSSGRFAPPRSCAPSR